MLPLTPRLLVSTATALASGEYHETPPDPDGNRAHADAECADASLRFVHFAGFWSHFALERGCSSWPLPQSEGFEELIRLARQQQALAPTPSLGDVFLLSSAAGDRYIRAGIVGVVESMTMMLNGVRAHICTTIEGEFGVVRAGEADPGITVRFVRRRLSSAFGDCFIRWCDLGAHASPVNKEYREPTKLVGPERARRRKAA
ncbi:MAG: hypothetical protein ACJ796_14120 [Gemmatimonadaceae bacterium]